MLHRGQTEGGGVEVEAETRGLQQREPLAQQGSHGHQSKCQTNCGLASGWWAGGASAGGTDGDRHRRQQQLSAQQCRCCLLLLMHTMLCCRLRAAGCLCCRGREPCRLRARPCGLHNVRHHTLHRCDHQQPAAKANERPPPGCGPHAAAVLSSNGVAGWRLPLSDAHRRLFVPQGMSAR